MDRVKFTIRQARLYAEIGQDEMAKTLGMSVGSYVKYEAYKNYLRVDKATKFAEAVKLPFDDIIFFDQQLHLNCS